jgi:hypothetical protein
VCNFARTGDEITKSEFQHCVMDTRTGACGGRAIRGMEFECWTRRPWRFLVELIMTAIASVPVASLASSLTRESVQLSHRRLKAQLLPLGAPNYSPEGLVSAIAEFCRARRSIGVPAAQVMIECTTLAASRLDSAGVRLVEVLVRQSLACPVAEELDGR